VLYFRFRLKQFRFIKCNFTLVLTSHGKFSKFDVSAGFVLGSFCRSLAFHCDSCQNIFSSVAFPQGVWSSSCVELCMCFIWMFYFHDITVFISFGSKISPEYIFYNTRSTKTFLLALSVCSFLILFIDSSQLHTLWYRNCVAGYCEWLIWMCVEGKLRCLLWYIIITCT
jgi:hypothetical protein